MSEQIMPVVAWRCDEPGCDYRINRAAASHYTEAEITVYEARVLPPMITRHRAFAHAKGAPDGGE